MFLADCEYIANNYNINFYFTNENIILNILHNICYQNLNSTACIKKKYPVFIDWHNCAVSKFNIIFIDSTTIKFIF